MSVFKCCQGEDPSVKGPAKCVSCGNEELVSAFLIDVYDHPVRAAKHRRPEAMIFKGKVRSRTTTFVCMSCGYAHLVVNEPGVLKEAGEMNDCRLQNG